MNSDVNSDVNSNVNSNVNSTLAAALKAQWCSLDTKPDLDLTEALEWRSASPRAPGGV